MIRGKALFEGTIWRILNSINNFNSERTLNIEGVPEIFKNLLKRAIVKCSQKRATAKELLDIILEKNVPKQEIILVNNLTYQTPRSRQGGSIDKLINVFQQQPKKNSIPSLSSINNPVTDSPYNINSLQISTNDILISGSADKTIKFWNIQTGQCIRTLNGHENDVRCFQMVGNEILLSGSDDKTIKVWLVKTFELMNTMTGHNGSVYCLQLIINRSTKETLVLSGSADETIKIWRFKTGQCLVTLRGHEDSVKSIQVVSEDIIISGSDDKTIRIWSIKQEKCLRTVTTRQYITCLEVLSNDTLISGSWDCTIQLWSIKTGNNLCYLFFTF
jgi:WD40 repeat protein